MVHHKSEFVADVTFPTSTGVIDSEKRLFTKFSESRTHRQVTVENHSESETKSNSVLDPHTPVEQKISGEMVFRRFRRFP